VKHFSEADWADFVRNLAPPKARVAMQQHLQDGCKVCQKTVEVWQGVVTFAANESRLSPPADSVRVAKSQFAAAMPQASRGVRLVFDSMLQPATAGIRGALAARQFLFETDDYYIDLRLEPRSAENRAYLVGQVLNRTGKRAAEALRVRLHQRKQSIAETATNQLGEFQLEFQATGEMYLAISHPDQDVIVLPLHGVPVERKSLD
jgi:hypothetical protein